MSKKKHRIFTNSRRRTLSLSMSPFVAGSYSAGAPRGAAVLPALLALPDRGRPHHEVHAEGSADEGYKLRASLGWSESNNGWWCVRTVLSYTSYTCRMIIQFQLSKWSFRVYTSMRQLHIFAIPSQGHKLVRGRGGGGERSTGSASVSVQYVAKLQWRQH